MASRIGLLRAVLNLDSTGFRQGFERAQAAAATFQKRMRRVEYKMKRFGRKMENIGQSMTLGITAPLLGAAGVAVKSAAEFETLAVQMEVLTGSAEEGAKAFEDLKRFSARTPFQLQDLVKAQNTLMGFGEETEVAFKHLKMLGDVAAVTGGDLQAITVAFGQASAEGKLMTRDIRQLINQGVPAIKLLAESMNVAQSEVLDLAEQGEITFPRLVESFRQATHAGGQFANGTERLADTLSGVFSTLKDNATIALSELGTSISETLDLKGVARNVSAALQNITDNFRAMSQESREQMLKIAAVLAASGPLAFAIGKMAKIIAGFSKFVRSKFFVISAAVAVVVTSIQWVADNWDSAIAAMNRQLESWVRATTNQLAFLGKAMSFFGRALPGAGAIFAGLDEAIMQLQGLQDEMGKTDFSSFGEAGRRAFGNIKDMAEELFSTLGEGMGLDRFMKLFEGSGGMSAGSGDVEMRRPSDTIISDPLNEKQLTLGLEKIRNATKITTDGMKDSFSEVGGAIQGVGDAMGGLVGRFIRLGKEALSLKNIAASILPALVSLIPGGGFGKSLLRGFFGGVFHQGGVVPGPVGQEKLILAQGGETVLTPEQMNMRQQAGQNQVIENHLFIDGREVELAIEDVKYRRNR